MLEKMRQSSAVGSFIFRANMIPQIYGDNRHGMIFMHNAVQAIRQSKFGKGDGLHITISVFVSLRFCFRQASITVEAFPIGDAHRC
jgi:hypothetical protein